jgi:hypothetical protein
MARNGTTSRLQQWYLARCDGEWEHGYGVRIATWEDDVPGWTIEINVPPQDIGLIDHDDGDQGRASWTHSEVRFNGSAGPLGLTHVLDQFLDRFGLSSGEDSTGSVDSVDAIGALQALYAAAPDALRIEINTLDNPGWCLHVVPTASTAGVEAFSHMHESDKDEHDWHYVKWEAPNFEAAAGPLHLESIIRKFLSLAE